MPTLRLLSVDARPFGRDRAALARAIGAARIDVAAVHGAPHLLRWRSISASVARRAGLVVVTGGRTAAANLLVSTLGVDVDAVRDVRLPRPSGFGTPGAALAGLRRGPAGFVFAGATLVGNAAERVGQARDVQAEIGTLLPGDPPAVICAEGADRPGTAAWQALAENRVAVAGRIFVDARITVGEVREQPGDPGSPVVVELELA